MTRLAIYFPGYQPLRFTKFYRLVTKTYVLLPLLILLLLVLPLPLLPLPLLLALPLLLLILGFYRFSIDKGVVLVREIADDEADEVAAHLWCCHESSFPPFAVKVDVTLRNRSSNSLACI